MPAELRVERFLDDLSLINDTPIEYSHQRTYNKSSYDLLKFYPYL